MVCAVTHLSAFKFTSRRLRPASYLAAISSTYPSSSLSLSLLLSTRGSRPPQMVGYIRRVWWTVMARGVAKSRPYRFRRRRGFIATRVVDGSLANTREFFSDGRLSSRAAAPGRLLPFESPTSLPLDFLSLLSTPAFVRTRELVIFVSEDYRRRAPHGCREVSRRSSPATAPI